MTLENSIVESIQEELNVHEFILNPDMTTLAGFELKKGIKLNFSIAGPRLGSSIKAVQAALSGGEYTIYDDGGVEVAGERLTEGEFDYDLELVNVQPELGGEFMVERCSNFVVLLDTTVTSALEAEGIAREFVRFIQDARKQAGFNVEDRIILHWDSADETVAAAIAKHETYIKKEALATEITRTRGEYEYTAEAKLSGGLVWFGISRK